MIVSKPVARGSVPEATPATRVLASKVIRLIRDSIPGATSVARGSVPEAPH